MLRELNSNKVQKISKGILIAEIITFLPFFFIVNVEDTDDIWSTLFFLWIFVVTVINFIAIILLLTYRPPRYIFITFLIFFTPILLFTIEVFLVLKAIRMC